MNDMPDVEQLRVAIHDWLCDNQPHTTKRPWFGWNCERGARRTFDILTANVVDWSALLADLHKGEP